MNQRLQQFLNAESLTQAEFAESIGVARASISHILAGRNKPGYEFFNNVAKRYPALNIDWFVTGRGKMYKTPMDDSREPVSAQAIEASPVLLFDEEPGMPNHVSPPAKIESNTFEKQRHHIENKKVINKIVVFYSDGTFDEYSKDVE